MTSTVALKRVAQVQYGLGQPPMISEDGIPILRATNIARGKVTERGLLRAKLEDLPLKRAPLLAEGEILVVRSGAYTGDSARITKQWVGSAPGYDLRVTPLSVESRYLAHALLSTVVQDQIKLVSSRAAQPHLNAEELGEVEIWAPPLEEQVRIADFLDAETARIDAISRAHSNQVGLLAERHRSWLSDLSTQLIGKYGSVRLRHVLMGIEQGWSPQCEDRLAGEGEWGVVKAGCVNGGTFDPLQHKRLPPALESRREYQLLPGDLLMSRASGSTELIGSVGIVPELNGQLLLLCDKVYRLNVDKTRGRAAFIAHMLRAHPVREHLKLGISGAAGMANNLPTPVVKDCLIPDAPLAEQDSAIDQLTRTGEFVDRTQRALARQLALLSERRQALITAAVTGQFDISTASGRGVDTQ